MVIVVVLRHRQQLSVRSNEQSVEWYSHVQFECLARHSINSRRLLLQFSRSRDVTDVHTLRQSAHRDARDASREQLVHGGLRELHESSPASPVVPHAERPFWREAAARQLDAIGRVDSGSSQIGTLAVRQRTVRRHEAVHVLVPRRRLNPHADQCSGTLSVFNTTYHSKHGGVHSSEARLEGPEAQKRIEGAE